MSYDWKTFLEICADVLGKGDRLPSDSTSWCAWTTFSRLQSDAGYWTAGLPGRDELASHGTRDGGTWGQPFLYSDLAHIVIPATFIWDALEGRDYAAGERQQDLTLLSSGLSEASLPHRRTELVLEVKLY